MIRTFAFALLIGCNSYVAPPQVKFVGADGVTAPPPIAVLAITVSGVTSVAAAGGTYLGVVISDGDGVSPSATVVHRACMQAAQAGGTHILLRHADRTTTAIDHVVTPRYGQTPAAARDGRGESFVEVPREQVHAVFDVFRVEPDHWSMLHPQMRPAALR